MEVGCRDKEQGQQRGAHKRTSLLANTLNSGNFLARYPVLHVFYILQAYRMPSLTAVMIAFTWGGHWLNLCADNPSNLHFADRPASDVLHKDKFTYMAWPGLGGV